MAGYLKVFQVGDHLNFALFLDRCHLNLQPILPARKHKNTATKTNKQTNKQTKQKRGIFTFEFRERNEC